MASSGTALRWGCPLNPSLGAGWAACLRSRVDNGWGQKGMQSGGVVCRNAAMQQPLRHLLMARALAGGPSWRAGTQELQGHASRCMCAGRVRGAPPGTPYTPKAARARLAISSANSSCVATRGDGSTGHNVNVWQGMRGHARMADIDLRLQAVRRCMDEADRPQQCRRRPTRLLLLPHGDPAGACPGSARA